MLTLAYNKLVLPHTKLTKSGSYGGLK